jgi:hydrogenase 3 maturation protease
VGQELRGDDAAGPAVVRALAGRLARTDAPAEPGPTLLILDAGPAPESQTGPLRRFAPDLVVLVDAARMGEPPGTVRWLPWQETVGLPGSTHTVPLSLLAQYLTTELACQVALLGIQPLDTEIGSPVSPPVQEAVDGIVTALVELLRL